eukprot:GHVS01023061.1.p1 GENE.GHVS01023061.1~~GHVS01023061.1.p1  ORF type:complete len:1212 (-),score=212.58 GHVS01023061.1:173-3571(-)
MEDLFEGSPPPAVASTDAGGATAGACLLLDPRALPYRQWARLQLTTTTAESPPSPSPSCSSPSSTSSPSSPSSSSSSGSPHLPGLFLQRHIGPSLAEQDAMLRSLNCNSLDELTDQTIPAGIRSLPPLPSPTSSSSPPNPSSAPGVQGWATGLSESEAVAKLAALASLNQRCKSFIGTGYYNTHLPAAIRRYLFENPSWYTAYTPYQAEVSQGRLEMLLNFQTVVTELTGMEIANASLLDESTAAAEAMAMIFREVQHKVPQPPPLAANKTTSDGSAVEPHIHSCSSVLTSSAASPPSSVRYAFFVSSKVHPQTIEVMRTRAAPMGLDLIIGDHKRVNFRAKWNLCGALVQSPDTEGIIENFSDLADDIHFIGGQLVVAVDPLSLCLVKPPSEFGADVVVGSMQRFGVPMGFGGPHAGFFATSKRHVRRMPGRIIGTSVDTRGRPAYRMTLQTREQHIRKEKATSNICTAQALLANTSAMYAIYHGPEGLYSIARRVHSLAVMLKNGLEKLGFQVGKKSNQKVGSHFFDTLKVYTGPTLSTAGTVEACRRNGLNIRPLGQSRVGISLDETSTEETVRDLLRAMKQAKESVASDSEAEEDGRKAGAVVNRLGCWIKRFRVEDALEIGKQFERKRELNSSGELKCSFMKQSIFNTLHSETEIMRYLKYLENKDLALNTSMISLGSCTMKLNPAASLQPVLDSAWADVHPFAPITQVQGYRRMIFQLCNYLTTITGLDAASVQPNSGASGEYAGLLAIRGYQSSIGEPHRNICIIPKSAHGTNPASAHMAGLAIKAIDSDSDGNIDIEQLKRVAEENSSFLCCLMITYPSTHGVFEPKIKEVCQLIHSHGGCVYMDGANLNAQLGLTSPGTIGADVCHINLHKTFAIPHGGGGPGVGPICVTRQLAPFLPQHVVSSTGHEPRGGSVSGAPFGSAMILPISWMFITLLGMQGLRTAAQVAILNANYMMKRLEGVYNIKYRGTPHGRCAHEFILDVSPFKHCGIGEEDIAKRLMDFGFHAPTMSWPVPASLMIEPTESESKRELDRFCDSMIAIREEIGKIESGEWSKDNNPVKCSPHTMEDVCSSTWNHPYTREQAAFPLPMVKQRGKFWPSVSRVDNAYGDKVLVCGCGDVSDYI